MKRFYIGLIGSFIAGLILATTTFALAANQPIKLIVNGTDITSQCDVPPQIIDGRTMVPVRFVAEALGADVEWIASQQTVKITKLDTAENKTLIDQNTENQVDNNADILIERKNGQTQVTIPPQRAEGKMNSSGAIELHPKEDGDVTWGGGYIKPERPKENTVYAD